jgi:hypothetical protein
MPDKIASAPICGNTVFASDHIIEQEYLSSAGIARAICAEVAT